MSSPTYLCINFAYTIRRLILIICIDNKNYYLKLFVKCMFIACSIFVCLSIYNALNAICVIIKIVL